MANGGSLHPSKRLKTEIFRPGSIIRIEVKNFMTYAHAVIEPGSRLNVALGPNGTGKSSLVCAMCVGLAGSTRLLGRADDVSSFVRRGTTDGHVIITLASKDPQKPHVIKRCIHAEDNSSQWFVDGNVSRMSDVVDIVKQYNIQLDNLCQFLPQDKVVEFARLKPIELLWATEAAVGDATLADTHKELVNARALYEQEKSRAEEIQSFVDRLRAENARSERTVAQIRERERLLQEAEDYRCKIPWAQYNKVKEEYDEELEKLKTSEKQLKTLENEQKKGDAPVKNKQRELDAAKTAEKKAKQEADAIKLAPLHKEAERLVDQAAKKYDEIKGIEEQADHLQQMIAKLEREIEQLKAKAEDTAQDERDIAEINKNIDMVTRQQKDLNTQDVALSEDRNQLDMLLDENRRSINEKERRVHILNDKKQQRLRALEGKSPGISKAWQWLQNNKRMFRGNIYGPLLMEVEVTDPLHARIIEQHVANAWWNHFIVEYQEDQDLLKKELMDNFKYKANVSYYSGDPSVPLQHPQGEWTQYARFGCTATLDQIFQAPQVVKHVMNDNMYIASTFVVGSVDANYQAIYEANPQIQVIFTPDSQIRRRSSNYNKNAVSFTHAPLKPCSLFVGLDRASLHNHQNGGGAGSSAAASNGAYANDADEVADLQKEIQKLHEEARDLNKKIGGIKNSKSELDNRRHAITAELKKLHDNKKRLARKGAELKANIKRKETSLQNKTRLPDPRQSRPRLERELNAILDQLVNVSVQLSTTYSKNVNTAMNYSYAELSRRELTDQVEKLTVATRERSQRVKSMSEAVQQYRTHVRRMKQTLDARKKEVEEAMGWPIPNEMKEKFANMPDDPNILDARAQAKEDEAEGLMITDPSALEHYKRRCDEIATSEETLKELEERRDVQAARIEELKATWLPQLRTIVHKINQTFSASFPNVGVAGEVALREAEGDDFANFAIEIRVKFRETEQLSVLDANRQSGGERSVSTILYLVALQGVAAAPFRVVDEINQGMDQYNERKAFKLLVDAATAPDTAQCFLLTPKLLPDLPFSSKVTVLQIFNGVHINSVAQGFTQEKLLGKERMAMLAMES